jgi:hypothetical protein
MITNHQLTQNERGNDGENPKRDPVPSLSLAQMKGVSRSCKWKTDQKKRTECIVHVNVEQEKEKQGSKGGV